MQEPLGSLSEKSNSVASSQEHPTKTRSPDRAHNHLSSSSSESDESDLDRTLKGDAASKQSLPLDLQGGSHPVFSPISRTAKIGSSTEEDSDLGGQDANSNVVEKVQTSSQSVIQMKRIHANNSRSDSTTLDDPNVWHGGDNNESQDDSEDEADQSSDGDMEEGEEDGEEESDRFAKLATTSSHALDVDFEDENSWGDLGNASDGDEEGTDDDDDDDESIIAGLPGMTSTPPVAGAKGMLLNLGVCLMKLHIHIFVIHMVSHFH